MKKLVIAIIAIIILIAFAPKIIGVKVANERAKLIAQLNAAKGISVKNTGYTPSWFGAQSISEVTFSLVQHDIDDITVIVDEQLSFGPIIVTKDDWFLALGYSEVKLHSSSALIDEEVMTFINKNLHLSTRLTFTNDVIAKVKTDEISFEDGNTQFNAAPAMGEFSVKNYKDFLGQLSWGGLVLKNNEGQLTIGQVSVDTQQSVVSGNYLQGTAILSGDANFFVESIEFRDISGNEMFSLQKLLFTSAVSVQNELLKLELSHRAAEMVALGQTFNKPNVDIILADLDVNALQELNNLLANTPMGSADVSAEFRQQVLLLAEKFIEKEPSLNITDLSVVTDSGKILSELTLTIDKQLFDNQNLMSVVSALNVDAKGNAPADFFSQFGVTAMINRFVEQGYLIKQDNLLSFVAKYSQAQLSLNGKVIQY